MKNAREAEGERERERERGRERERARYLTKNSTNSTTAIRLLPFQ